MESGHQHHSAILKEQALNNLKTKHAIVKLWVGAGIPWNIGEDGERLRDTKGELVLDWYPTSLRSFCAWDRSQNCGSTRKELPEIFSNGYETLSQYVKLKSKIEADISALKQKANTQLIRNNKAHLIHSLKAELELEVRKRKSAQVSYQQGREELLGLSRELETEKRAHLQTTAYLKAEISRKDQQIATLSQRVSNLTASLDKVAPIRVVKE